MYDVVRCKLESGRLASDDDVAEVCRAVDGVLLEDLGLDRRLHQAGPDPQAPQRGITSNHAGASCGASCGTGAVSVQQARAAAAQDGGGRTAITYLHIHEDPSMTVGIFCLPAGARIPLHNHPGMTVFSRLLYGTMHLRAYDWTNTDSSGSSSSSGVHLAKLVADRVLSAPAPTSVLFPASGGNIHAFTAITPCAILDVLAPPYAPADGRDCTYYRERLPPALLDAAGRPLLPTAEAVAAAVLASASRADGGRAGTPDAFTTPVVRRLAASRPAGTEVVVGLEEWEAPADFEVVRGAYRGRTIDR